MANESLFTSGLYSLTTKLTRRMYRLGFWKLIDLNRQRNDALLSEAYPELYS